MDVQKNYEENNEKRTKEKDFIALPIEKQKEYHRLGKLRDELQLKFESAPEKTKEKGDYLLEYCHVTKEQFKIYSHFTDRRGLEAVAGFYATGLKLGKWKK